MCVVCCVLKGVSNNFLHAYISTSMFVDVNNFLIKDSICLLLKLKFDKTNEQFFFGS